jgi:AraC-like DNA-binding protein
VYQPYSLIFHAAHTPHQDSIGESGCRMFFIELLDSWSDIVDTFAGSTQHVFELDGSDPAWIALRLHREFLERDSGSSNAVESLLYELLAWIGSRPHDEMHEPEWLPAVEAQLREHFASRVSLRELAGTIGINPAHLCRAFRRFRGRTIGDFTTNLRVQFVCRRLTESDDSLSAIAHAGGFTDQSHMTRIFKRSTNVSPGAYRKKN